MCQRWPRLSGRMSARRDQSGGLCTPDAQTARPRSAVCRSHTASCSCSLCEDTVQDRYREGSSMYVRTVTLYASTFIMTVSS